MSPSEFSFCCFCHVLAIISPSCSCSSYSWNEWNVRPFFFTTKTTQPRAQVFSVTVPLPVAGCIFDVISSLNIAYENIRFSSLFGAGDVSRGGTSATQRQKFHTDDANQCLHNKSSSHGVPNTKLSNFTCLLVDFGKVMCSSAKELQQNSNTSSRKDYIPQILTILFEILRVCIWPLWPFVFCLSFVNNS